MFVVIEGGVGRGTLYKALSKMIPDLLVITSMPDPPSPKLSELFEAPKFLGEETTKGHRMIHAWSYDKAREYVAKIIETAE